MFPAAEIFSGSQNLSAGYTLFAEQFVIAVYQFRLPYSGIKLPGRYRIQFFPDIDFTPSRSDGAGRYKYNLQSVPVQFRNLVDYGGHARDVQSPVPAGEDIAPYLYRYSFILKHFSV
jgi:hypothetical protein